MLHIVLEIRITLKSGLEIENFIECKKKVIQRRKKFAVVLSLSQKKFFVSRSGTISSIISQAGALTLSGCSDPIRGPHKIIRKII